MIVSLKLINSEPVTYKKNTSFGTCSYPYPLYVWVDNWHLFLEFHFYCSNYDQYIIWREKTYLSICLFVLSRFSPNFENFLAMKGLLDPITQLDISTAKKCQERILDAHFFLRQHLHTTTCVSKMMLIKKTGVWRAHISYGEVSYVDIAWDRTELSDHHATVAFNTKALCE